LAGTLGELTHRTLKDHFRSIDPAETNIFLLGGCPRISTSGSLNPSLACRVRT
jgi:hypothetical protein